MASVATLRCFIGPKGKEGYFGVAAFERALMAGFTVNEIKDRLKEENLTPGDKLKQILA